MKTEKAESASTGVSTLKSLDSSKLLSLLALAAGAGAIPQGAQADIIFTDLSGAPPTVGANNSSLFVLDNLPGIARLGFIAKSKMTAVTSSRWVTVGQQAGYAKVKNPGTILVPLAAGLNWNQAPGIATASATVGKANFYGHLPAGYDHKYFVFRFQDTTQAGSPLRYGWVELSLSQPSNNAGPDVTIFGYAYDDTGALILTGTVPEPGSVAIAALGALMLGAKGVRHWRRQRPAQPKKCPSNESC